MPIFPQLERLLWLHKQAKNGRYPNSRLAEHFQVSTKTISGAHLLRPH